MDLVAAARLGKEVSASHAKECVIIEACSHGKRPMRWFKQLCLQHEARDTPSWSRFSGLRYQSNSMWRKVMP